MNRIIFPTDNPAIKPEDRKKVGAQKLNFLRLSSILICCSSSAVIAFSRMRAMEIAISSRIGLRRIGLKNQNNIYYILYCHKMKIPSCKAAGDIRVKPEMVKATAPREGLVARILGFIRIRNGSQHEAWLPYHHRRCQYCTRAHLQHRHSCRYRSGAHHPPGCYGNQIRPQHEPPQKA